MHILWYGERVEEIHEVSYISCVCFVDVDVAARLPKLFRTPLLPPKGAVGSLRGGRGWGEGLTQEKIAESWSCTDLRTTTQNKTCSIHSNQTRKIMHRAFFISFIFKLFGNSVRRVFFFLRGFLNRQLIITEKKFNRHHRKLILVGKFFHHVPFSLILKLLIYYRFVFKTNFEGSWMVLFMRSRRIR